MLFVVIPIEWQRMLCLTKAGILVSDSPSEEGCANTRVVQHTGFQEVVVDSGLLLQLCITIVGSLDIKLSNMDLKTEIGELFDDFINILAGYISIRSPVM